MNNSIFLKDFVQLSKKNSLAAAEHYVYFKILSLLIGKSTLRYNPFLNQTPTMIF